MEKKLYKSEKDKKFLGVCGGFAEYFSIDSTIIRLIWTILSLVHDIGIAAYFICALVMPERPESIEDINEKIDEEDF